jgi:putative nucleotidyltransferase with HDIG domain
MEESSLFQHFRKAFSKYAIALALLFLCTAIANITYQVHLYQKQTEIMISESADAYFTQKAELNQLLIYQFFENDQLLSAYPLDRDTKKFAQHVIEDGEAAVDLFYLSNGEETSFYGNVISQADFESQIFKIKQGAVRKIGEQYYLFSTYSAQGTSIAVGEKIDEAFMTTLIHFLPISVENISIDHNKAMAWNQKGFEFPLPGIDATLTITTQLDIKAYVLQSAAFPASFFLVGSIVLYLMFKGEIRRINPFLENTRIALEDIGMGQPPVLPDSEVEEANLLYGSVHSLFRQLQEKDIQVKQSHLEMIQLLNAAIGTSDAYTNGHSQRVEAIASNFGKTIGYFDQDTLAVAARLHDIGKLGIPTDILNKPGKLDKDEFATIKDHPSKGAEILCRSEFFKNAVPLVRHHHEHWDGSGYPDHLSGNAIPMGAQILTLADVYDALTTNRPYRKALTHQEAMRIIRDESGSTFNPILADQFLAFLSDSTLPNFLKKNISA